ncbi:MAG: hypothetical protein ACYC7E_00145 [Armatimonadota bacterium]
MTHPSLDSPSTASIKPWGSVAQRQRRLEQAALIRERFRPLLDDRACSDHLYWWDQDRVAIWSSNAFFLGNEEDIAFGNTILRYVRDVLPPTSGPNVFGSAAMSGVMMQHGHLLENDVKEFGLRLLDTCLPDGTTRDYTFHGFNDNMPVMWSWALCAGGELLDNPRFTEVSWANLCQLKDMFRRRGTVSEYGQNYGTHRLTGIAHIAELSRHPEFRALALQLEARIWAELAGHWHPRLATVGGAAMRGGYPFAHETSALLRQVFGDAITIPAAPWMGHYKTDEYQPGYIFAYPFAYGAEFAAAEYHVPDEVAELFYQKPIGFTFQCTAEQGYANAGVFCKQESIIGVGGGAIGIKLTDQVVEIPFHPAHGAQEHGLITYHGANYSVGSATTNMFNTSHAFRCQYRRSEDARTPADYGEVLVRYNINDKVAGNVVKNSYWKGPDYPYEYANYCHLPLEMGTHHCLQDGNTVMCLQVPDWNEYWDVRSLRTDIFFYQAHGKVGRVFVGDREVTGLPFSSATEEIITVDEGAVYLAIHPLIGRSRERQAAMTIHEEENFLVVSLYNYEGSSLNLSPRDMAKLGNGFVFEARDAADFNSFADFQTAMRLTRVHDQLYGGVRTVHYARPDARLSLVVCPYANTVMSRSVNGLNHAVPQFSFSDGRHASLPFLDSTPAVGFEDWEWITTQINRDAETYNPID